MKIKISIVTLSFISFSFLYGMGTWIFNNRSHGELRWSTIKTENFDVHYHDDIREIAVRGASMAEQIRPVLMKQMGITNLPRLDIAFTAEDEVLNGFLHLASKEYIAPSTKHGKRYFFSISS